MPLRFHTAPYAYAGTDRLDVTRVGVDKAALAGEPTPGRAFAPSARILWPAKTHIDLVLDLERRADMAALRGTTAEAWLRVQAERLLAETEDAYNKLYIDELRGSWVRQRPAWTSLLKSDEATLVCFCARREPGGTQRHHCHRHYLAAALAACGATDMGERDMPQAGGGAARKARPMVAITGCRPPKSTTPANAGLYQRICHAIRRRVAALPPDAIVVHGGADGSDTIGGDAALATNRGVRLVRPWYDAWGKDAPTKRNAYVGTCPLVLAFPAPWSSPGGTPMAIDFAIKAGCRVEVYDDDSGAMVVAADGVA